MLEAQSIVRRGPNSVRVRSLQVKAVTDVIRRYSRVVLEGFLSDAPDDHVKLVFPDMVTDELVLMQVSSGPVFEEAGRARMRDFTPRAFDAGNGELTIDIALRGEGVASAWVVGASRSTPIDVGGPRRSIVISYDFDWYFLVGDKSALPAIARPLEDLPSGSRAVVQVDGAEDEQPPRTAADARVTWVHRSGTDARTAPMLEVAFRSLELPAGHGFVFVAVENVAVRSIRDHLAERGQSREAQRVSVYWKRGARAFHE